MAALPLSKDAFYLIGAPIERFRWAAVIAATR